MNYLLLTLFLFSYKLEAQSILKFDKVNIQCEDKWVAYPMNKDDVYTFGYIYIDEQYGLTFNYEGEFTIDDKGQFILSRLIKTGLKTRLQPNQIPLAIIPESKFNELKIDANPSWMQYYKRDANTLHYLFRKGYLYNSWNECSVALPYLEKAMTIDPQYKGLRFELGHAYNDTKQYDKAEAVLLDAIMTSPNEFMLYREVLIAQIQLGKLDLAAKSTTQALYLCTDEVLKANLAFNMAEQYFLKLDKTHFPDWAEETRKWCSKRDPLVKKITAMEIELSK